MRLPALLLLLAASSLLTAHGAWAQETQPSIPRSADGKPDFSGIWQTLSAAEYDLEPHSTRKDAPPGPGIVEGQVIPYRPEASQQRKKNFDARATNDPREKCFTLGTPRGIYSPEPFQIFQRARDLTLVFQFGHSVRTIHTNETRHPKARSDSGSVTPALDGKGTRSSSMSSTSTARPGSIAPGTSTATNCTSSSAGPSSTPTRFSTPRRSRTRRCTRGRGA